MWDPFVSQASNDRTRGHRLKLHQRGFRLQMKRNFLIEKGVRHFTDCQRRSPSSHHVFNKHMEVFNK